MVNPFDNISKLANSVGETFKGKTEHTAEVTQEKNDADVRLGL